MIDRDNKLTATCKITPDCFNDAPEGYIDRRIDIMYDGIKEQLKDRKFIRINSTEEDIELIAEIYVFTGLELRRYKDQVINEYLLDAKLLKP